jgi:hypothetical protein
MHLKLVFVTIVFLLTSYTSSASATNKASAQQPTIKKTRVYYEFVSNSDNLLFSKNTMYNRLGLDYMYKADTEASVGIALYGTKVSTEFNNPNIPDHDQSGSGISFNYKVNKQPLFNGYYVGDATILYEKIQQVKSFGLSAKIGYAHYTDDSFYYKSCFFSGLSNSKDNNLSIDINFFGVEITFGKKTHLQNNVSINPELAFYYVLTSVKIDNNQNLYTHKTGEKYGLVASVQLEFDTFFIKCSGEYYDYSKYVYDNKTSYTGTLRLGTKF